MTDSADTRNTAEAGSSVGIQAQSVEDSTVYMNSTIYNLADNATPGTKYSLGLKYLEAGMPARALDLISDAIAHGLDDGEARFHWVLAMLSKRSFRDLTDSENEQLARVWDRLGVYADDKWKQALDAIHDMLDSLSSPADVEPALKKLDDVPSEQRAMIDRHLDLVLTGSIKDGLWARVHERAECDRVGDDREGRVWAYFQPEPFKARAREPEEISTTLRAKTAAVAWAGVFVAGFGGLGWEAAVAARPLPIAMYVLGLAFGGVAAADGLVWHYKKRRLEAMNLDFENPGTADRSPQGGFADTVTRDIRYYFAKYLPKDVERDDWLSYTAGMRASLRDEIVEIYREERIPAGRVRWLGRFHARQAKTRWEAGGDWTGRSRFRTAWSTRARCVLAFSLSLGAVTTVVATLVSASPVVVSAMGMTALVGGGPAAKRLARICSERRRLRDQKAEREQLLAERRTEFERWKAKLDRCRPTEAEMEYWLYCDKTILLGNALRHYRLAWRDVIAHAFLQAPGARNYKRARVTSGPWRYSRYDIRLFLVTLDGVREVLGEIDFENAELSAESRRNFRFDAVSSVSVFKAGMFYHVLELSLNNGPARQVRITDPIRPAEDDGQEEDLTQLSEINLDATGFRHALHILEGIAAEGKEWIARDPEVKSRAEGLARRAGESDPAFDQSEDAA